MNSPTETTVETPVSAKTASYEFTAEGEPFSDRSQIRIGVHRDRQAYVAAAAWFCSTMLSKQDQTGTLEDAAFITTRPKCWLTG